MTQDQFVEKCTPIRRNLMNVLNELKDEKPVNVELVSTVRQIFKDLDNAMYPPGYNPYRKY